MHLNEMVNVHYVVMYASANVVYYTAWFSLLCVATKGVKIHTYILPSIVRGRLVNSKMAEVITLLERIQRNQDDIIRRLGVSDTYSCKLHVCIHLSLRGRLSTRYVAQRHS